MTRRTAGPFVGLIAAAGCAAPQVMPPVPVPPAEARPTPGPDAAVPLPLPKPVPADAPPAPGPVPPIQGGTPSVGGPLALGELLDSVERSFPLLKAVEQERLIAAGRLQSSYGAFDLNVTAGADGQGTVYDNVRTNFALSQALPTNGATVFAGHRTGLGEFATYYLNQKTAHGGEFRAGVAMPLLRDRAIDRPRATIRQAELDTQIAEPTIDRQRLDVRRAAARAYWNWVAAGHRLAVAAAQVKLADERDGQLKARVAAGPAAAIERTDNQQNLALRNGLLVQAQRAFQQATIELSLYLRDAAGAPTLAGPDRLPDFPDPAPLAADAFAAALQTALERRPEPTRLRLQREKAGVELRLAENQALPQANLVVAAAQDVGYGTSSTSGPNGLDRTTVTAGLTVGLPVQRREANGRAAAARAAVGQIDQQLRYAQDAVRAEVQDAYSALERAYEFHAQAKARVELVRTVARAERLRFREGTSDVLRVTLREQAVFEAEVVEIGAKQDYFRARADLLAAAAQDVDTPNR